MYSYNFTESQRRAVNGLYGSNHLSILHLLHLTKTLNIAYPITPEPKLKLESANWIYSRTVLKLKC